MGSNAATVWGYTLTPFFSHSLSFMAPLESCFWDVCMDPMCKQALWTDLLSDPPTIFLLLYSKLFHCIVFPACSTFHSDINKCHHLSQAGTSPTNFATWKPIWNSTRSGDDVQTSSMSVMQLQYILTMLLFFDFTTSLPAPTGFASVLSTSDYSNLIPAKQSHSLRTGGNTCCTTHFPLPD